MTPFLTDKARFLCCHGRPFQIVPNEAGIIVVGEARLLTLAAVLGARLAGPGVCGAPDIPPSVACRFVTAVVAGIAPPIAARGSPLLTRSARGFTNGLPPECWRVADPGQAIIGLGAAPRATGVTTGTEAAEPVAVAAPTPPAGPHWIEIELAGRAGRPAAAGERYRIILPDQTVVEGRLDPQGHAQIDGITTPGQCVVSFPELDASSWSRR